MSDLPPILAGAKPVEPVKPAPPPDYPPAGDARPCFRVYDDWWLDLDNNRHPPGTWWLTNSKHEKPQPVDHRIAGPCHKIALSCDEYDENHGLSLRFQTMSGGWREDDFPYELLAGSGEDLRACLLSKGLEINPKYKNQFMEYLSYPPKEKRLAVTSSGWANDGAFVLGDEIIGPKKDGIVIRSMGISPEAHGVAGSLSDWRAGIASLATDNPLAVLAISIAFAPPLLDPAGIPGFTFHLIGDAASGKTTLLNTACSVWGPPSFGSTWDATRVGLEVMAVERDNCLMCLDELGQANPKTVGNTVYTIANGFDRVRGAKTGGLRPIHSFLTAALSTGERSLASHMGEEGKLPTQGQETRFIEIPAKRSHGVFDELHGFDNHGGLSRRINEAASLSYGAPIRAFLGRLTKARVNGRDFRAEYAALLNDFLSPDLTGGERRAASNFALIAFAGELATEYGITDWHSGNATKASAECFYLWRQHRGPERNETR